MTPVRHMQTCVPLPVPRAQAELRIIWSEYYPGEMFVHALGWLYPADVLRHFGPKRTRRTR